MWEIYVKRPNVFERHLHMCKETWSSEMYVFERHLPICTETCT